MEKKGRKLWKLRKSKHYSYESPVVIFCVGINKFQSSKLFPYSDLHRKQTHYLCYYNYPTHKPHTCMQFQLEAISLPGLLQANYIFSGSTKLLSLYYMSFLSAAPETEKPSASHFICGDICYSLGNYYSHPGFTAHSKLQCSCH